MDAHLKTLASCGLAIGAAEEACGEGAFLQARDLLDEATAALADLRAAWPDMTASERVVIGQTAAPLKARLDALVTALPRVSAVSEGTPELDPEQDAAPDAATEAA